LDKTDESILGALRENARMTVKEISRKLELPRSTVHDRIQRLDKSKVIKQWTIVPDYQKTGKPITAFVLAKYLHSEGLKQPRIAEEIAKLPNVCEVHMITGNWDFLIKARVSDIHELSQLTIDRLGEMKGIGERVTATSLRCAKEEI